MTRNRSSPGSRPWISVRPNLCVVCVSLRPTARATGCRRCRHIQDDRFADRAGSDFFHIADAAVEVVTPTMPVEFLLDRNALIMGYSGVYLSLLEHAIRQSERYGVPAHQLLHRAGRRELTGGQEDQLIDIALEIKREQDTGAAH